MDEAPSFYTAFLSAVAHDYHRIAEVILDSVLQDKEEHLPDAVDNEVRKAEQRIASDQGSIFFPDKRLTILHNVAKDLRQALPAQRAAKRRQTRVLM